MRALRLALLLLCAPGLHGVPAVPGWSDIWSWPPLRSARDASVPAANTSTSSSTTTTTTEPLANSTAVDTAQALAKQASDRMASMWLSVRSSAASTWQGALDKLTGTGPSIPEQQQQQTTTTATPPLDTIDKVDVGQNVSDVIFSNSSGGSSSLDSSNSSINSNSSSIFSDGSTSEVPVQPPPQPPQQQPGLVASALQRVREVGRAVSSTVSRWSKAMAGTMGTAADAVNSAVGTVWQVINGGKQSDDIDHVCYDGLGCFSLREPWVSSQRPLPRMNSPEQVHTKFYLHTRNRTDGEELLLWDDNLANCSMDPAKRTFLIVHGFNDKSGAAWVEDIKDALLEKVDGNVVLVDWSQGAAASKNYLQAASNTRIVGAELGRLLGAMSEQLSLPLDQVHAVGHSLGAHVAGYAGKRLGGRLGRITALDAAQPAFEDQDPEVRIAATDAQFVDALHTNGVPFIPTLGLGVMHSVADVDFYLNGGTVQPGCFVPKLPPVNSLADLAALPVSVLGDMLSCSHRRAIEYFTEAVRSSCRMWGRRRADDDSKADSSNSPQPTSAQPGLGSTRSSWWRPSTGLSLLASVFSGEASTEPVPVSGPRAAPRKPTRAATQLADVLHAPAWCGDDCLPVGLDTDRFGMKGTFSVATSDRAPYCMTDAYNEV